MAFEKKIKLEIAGTDYEFLVTPGHYDELRKKLGKPDAKSKQILTNFLSTTVEDNQANQLLELIQRPGVVDDVANVLIEEYREDVEIVVKK